jgi:hypothetical protein
MWATEQSGGAPDSHCSLSGAPSGACSDSARAVARLTFHCRLLQTTVGAFSRCSTGTPDSPVNYSRGAPRIIEAEQFRVILPGAPDTVQWCTGHCPVAHRTIRCARPGQSSVALLHSF